MALRKIRATVGRFVVITGLAVVVIAGSVAVSNPADVAAAPKLTCAQALALGDSWQVYGDLLYGYGYYWEASRAYAKTVYYYGYC